MCEIEKTRLKHFLPPEHIQISYIAWIKSDFMENKLRKNIVTSRFDVPKARSPKKQVHVIGQTSRKILTGQPFRICNGKVIWFFICWMFQD